MNSNQSNDLEKAVQLAESGLHYLKNFLTASKPLDKKYETLNQLGNILVFLTSSKQNK